MTISNQGIKKISVNAELHDDRRDFDIEIDQSRVDVINRVFELAKEVGVKLRHWSNRGGSIILTSKDISRLKDFSNKLTDYGLINYLDRCELEETLKKIDNIVSCEKKIIEGATVAQKEILETMASPYIEALLEDSSDFKDIIPLICSALGNYEYIGYGPLWEQQVLKRQGKSDKEIKASMECMKHLSTFMRGMANLGSTFLQMGVGIPSLKQQRHIIIDFIKRNFENKYGKKRGSEFDELYLEMAINRLIDKVYLCRPISSLYCVNINGFPEKNNSGLTKKYENKLLPNENEKALLKKYGLKRFPVSIEDMKDAKASHKGEIIENPRELRLLIDKELYPDRTPMEKIAFAIYDDEDDEIEKILHESSVDINNQPIVKHYLGAYGENAINLAILHRSKKVVKKLIELGADVNSSSNSGSTALHMAAFKVDIETIKLLLKHGATFNTDDKGNTPLHRLFMQAPSEKLEPEKIVEAAKLLMNAGSVSDIDNLFNVNGNNCLHIAANCANRGGILALIKLGIDVGKKNKNSMTIFDLIHPLTNHPLAGDEELHKVLIESLEKKLGDLIKSGNLIKL